MQSIHVPAHQVQSIKELPQAWASKVHVCKLHCHAQAST